MEGIEHEAVIPRAIPFGDRTYLKINCLQLDMDVAQRSGRQFRSIWELGDLPEYPPLRAEQARRCREIDIKARNLMALHSYQTN